MSFRVSIQARVCALDALYYEFGVSFRNGVLRRILGEHP